MTHTTIRDLFASQIDRRIEEVIKVDQKDDQLIREELAEYVVTDSIRGYLTDILERYLETPNKPHEGIAVWISGFFGSGKSSFAKYLGLALENRDIVGEPAGRLLASRTGDNRVRVLLDNIGERIPTHAVIFDVSTDRGIRSGNQGLTEIMYRLFLQSLGYARDLDLSELEITLEEQGRLHTFKARYEELYKRDWDQEKGKIALALQQASRVMHSLEPDTYPTADSWRQAALRRADISPGDLAKRGIELMNRRREDRNLLFVVDEVGQFVARDVQKMLDLQAVVQNLGRVGRGRMWIVVTSQEKLTELVGGLDDKRVELARLMDRFPLQVHLEPSDISEVTSQRILSKTAEAEKSLAQLFALHRGRLTDNTRLTADIKLPELTTESFTRLYPLLPYQIELIIRVVSGLRTQGGASKHVGGAARTIIKLAQQLLIHPGTAIADAPVGVLARLDQLYDLVSGNIQSEVRGKIAHIEHEVDHELAVPVAKAICLLQYVQSIHRTPQNIAATLHPAVDADSRLPEVHAALEALEKALMIRRGEDGYRIPTPAEDDWEQQRAKLEPTEGERRRLILEQLVGSIWKPQPSHTFLDVKQFRAGLTIAGRVAVDGDIPFHIVLAPIGSQLEEALAEARRRSQSNEEKRSVFWVAGLGESLAYETGELYRSQQMLTRRERGAQTRDEGALVAEEKRRVARHREALIRLLKQALLTGVIYFRGNERSPDETASDVGRTAAQVLRAVLPEVFSRFEDAAARVSRKDLECLTTTENLRGVTPIFNRLSLLREEKKKPVFITETGPLAEVLARVEERSSFGDIANGRYLEDKLGAEPFGWEFDMVKLLTLSLLRAGKIEATSKGKVIESAISLEVGDTFTNNNLFRQASFRPRTTDCTFKDYVDAAQAFTICFGREVIELEESVIADEIRKSCDRHEDGLRDMASLLQGQSLPGSERLEEALSHITGFRRQRNCQALKAFTACHLELKEAIQRRSELAKKLHAQALELLERARTVLEKIWPVLDREAELEQSLRESRARLADLLQKETFFNHLPAIDEHAAALEQDFQLRYKTAADARRAAYLSALERLRATSGWEQLTGGQQEQVVEPLEARVAIPEPGHVSLALLRADIDACAGRLSQAIERMLRLVDGNRIALVDVGSFFAGGIETEDQLDAALEGMREQCLELIGAGQKVLVK